MELSDFYPPPRELIENELRVLARLKDDPYIAAEHSGFARDATIYHSRYRDLRSGFAFSSYFDVFHAEMPERGKGTKGKQQANLRLIVAAIIEQRSNATYGNLSYALAVCRIHSSHLSILRKFHFDVTASVGGSKARRQPHPMCHLQYCGGMLPLMAEMGLRQAQLQNMQMKLSEPRIFFWPMSLALLIDMALHEFPDVRSAKFRKAPEWQGIIHANEAFLLLPFHKSCVEVIEDSGSKIRTLADEFYVG